MQRRLAIIFLAVAAYTIYAQSSKTFEAAIIRPSGPDSTFQFDLTGTQLVTKRVTLRMLVQSSYPDLPSWRISGGPPWANAETWDLIAKLPAGTTGEQEPLYRATEAMLKTFLADEFKLKTHFEQREQPVYELVITKGGLKARPTEAAKLSLQFTPTGIRFQHETMQEFTMFLFCPSCARQTADRPVIDKTGLTGLYDFSLNWSPANVQTDTASGPSIFTALEEQLGLKLQPARAPVDFLVIDQAERPLQN